jgi:hypothetical protein
MGRRLMAGCGVNPLCLGKEAVGDVVGDAAGSAVGALADAVGEGVTKAVASLGTVWVKVGTPNVTTADGTSASPTVAFIQSQLWWYMAAAAILAVIIGGARMAWEQRAEPGRELLKGLLTLVVVSGCGLATISLAVSAADQFARGIVDASLHDNSFGKNVATMLGFSSAASGGALGPLLVIVLGLMAILVAVVQIMLMVVRAGMLVLLAGALPLAASFTSTEAGRAWFRRFAGWLLAYVLYKPAAAIVYAAAFKLMESDVFSGDGLLSVLVGLALMVTAVIALPALLRFLVPMTSAVAGSGGGGGGAMLAAAMPTGAIALGNRMAFAPAGGGPSGGMGGAGSPGPGGAAGPSGATGSPGPSGGDGPPGGGRSGANGSGGAAAEPRAAAGPAGAPGQSGASAAGAGGATAGGAGAAGASAGAAGGASGAAAGAGPAGAAAGAAVSAADGARRGVKSAAEGAAGSSDEDEEGPRGSR